MKASSLKLLFSLMLILSLSIIGSSQILDSDEKFVNSIPDQALEQVVHRILVWNFKPRNRKKVVYLAANGVQKSWLPEIRGIEFQLLSETEIGEKERVYFFTQLGKRSLNRYYIGFAFGDPTCNYTGASWYIRKQFRG